MIIHSLVEERRHVVPGVKRGQLGPHPASPLVSSSHPLENLDVDTLLLQLHKEDGAEEEEHLDGEG